MLRILQISLIFLVSFSILLEVEKTAIYTLWYQVDNESFVDNYCNNVEQPELDCAGSCRISSELIALSDGSKNPLQMTPTVLHDIVYHLEPMLDLKVHDADFVRRTSGALVVQLYCYQFAYSEFHPPTYL